MTDYNQLPCKYFSFLCARTAFSCSPAFGRIHFFRFFFFFAPFLLQNEAKNLKNVKSKFQLANVMQSTRFLVKIHNSQTSTDLMITYTVVGRPSCRLISLSRKEGIIIFKYSCLCTNIPIIALLTT